MRGLRAAQFPEDAGPLAHPIRPDSYMEISNFYTATIYNKGAEVIRMMATILGPERFRMATDLYFDRYDGTAATCEDFVRCMEIGGGVDLTPVPPLVSPGRDAARVGRARSRRRVGPRDACALRSARRRPRASPTRSRSSCRLRIKLFGGETGAALSNEQLYMLDQPNAEIMFDGITERPVLSINRGFSAPVIIESDRSAGGSRLPVGARRRSVRALRGDAAIDARHAGDRGRRWAAPIISR